MWPRRLNWFAALASIIVAVTAVSIVEIDWLWRDAESRHALLLLTVVRHLIELLCVAYAVCFSVAAIRYVRASRRATVDDREVDDGARTAVIYLCCNDLEPEAVRTLSRFAEVGAGPLLLHDDSTDPRENARVDECVRRVALERGVEWRVLRRPRKGGGKAAALQEVLEQTAHEHDRFVLADNDSFVVDPTILRRAAVEFEDPDVAIVQFRNRARPHPDDGPFGACLAGAIDIFDAFATGLFDRLWRPFVGHNAVLRTDATMAAGGFTPGFFADDIDLTVRLALRGQRVVYRRDLEMEECHPTNYRSFSLRSKKWAQGCAQILRTHLLPVLDSDRMTFREKLGFLLFCGFYVTQVAMLLYVLLVFVALPLLVGPNWSAAWWALAIGTIVPLSIFMPVIAYLRTDGRHLPFFRTLGACAATYGSTDLWTILGLAAGFSRRERGWIPTNSVLGGDRPLLDWGHFAFGSAVLLVPLAHAPALLAFPLTWLFAAKFMFVPAVAVHYGTARAVAAVPATSPVAHGATMAGLALVAALALGSETAMADGDAPDRPEYVRVEIDGRRLLIDGRPRIIRGIHYGPWRPGTGPGRGFDYPSDSELRQDFALIADLGADTILVYDPPRRLFDLASEFELDVIHVFNVQWWMLPDEERVAELVSDIGTRTAMLADHPAVICWMIGNEIPGWVVDVLEPAGVRAFLASARAAVREHDPWRPVTYGNWPLHRTLDLDADMDLVAYNVYPFYPTEVAVLGYGRFIREQLIPRAGDRPFIVSEFGLNTIEATGAEQAETIVRCWRQLLDAGAQGGIVFAFADEWWKNYDNPIRPPDWWRRRPAPDDHLTHDDDPEEHYGIVTAHRVPKPAYEAVRRMFTETEASALRRDALERALWGIGAVGVAALMLTAIWLRVRSPNARSGADSGTESQHKPEGAAP